MDAEAALDRAGRLLRFLARSRLAPPDHEGAADALQVRLDDAPAHPEIRLAGPGDGGLVLVVGPVRRHRRPPCPVDLLPWISGDIDRPTARLRLRARATTSAGRDDEADHGAPVVERLSERPDVREAWEAWHTSWVRWSEAERADAPAVSFREAVLRILEAADADQRPVLAVGLLTGPDLTPRHLFTVPVVGSVDADGRLTLRLDPHARGLTLDDTALLDLAVDRHTVGALASDARAHPCSPLDAARLIDLAAPLLTDRARTVGLAPTLRLRRGTGITPTALHRVADRMADSGRVPAGLLPLFDPTTTPDRVTVPGALFPLDDAALCPGLLDPTQRAVVESVDRNTQTVVHTTDETRRRATVTALTTHLLAQGRRVLVTASTAEALRGLRASLAEDLRPLVLSTVDDVGAAEGVDAIVRAFTDAQDRATSLDHVLARVEELRVGRRELLDDAGASREREGATWTVRGTTGTIAEIARRHAQQTEHAWAEEFATPAPDAELPVTSDEVLRLRDLLRDPACRDLAPRYHGRRPDLGSFLPPEEVARLVDRFDAAARRASGPGTDDPRLSVLLAASEDDRDGLRQALDDLRTATRDADGVAGAWAEQAVRDVVGGRTGPWLELAREVDRRLTAAAEAVEAIGGEVVVLDEVPDLPTRVDYLREHLLTTGPLVVDASGIPRLGVAVPDPVRIGHVLFRNLRVDGRPPSSVGHLDVIRRHLVALDALDDVDAAWPEDTVIPVDDSPRARLERHVDLMRGLVRLLDLADVAATATTRVRGIGLTAPDWAEGNRVAGLLDLLDAAAAQTEATAAGEPLTDLVGRVSDAALEPDVPDALRDLREAAVVLDVEGYARAWTELAEIDRLGVDLDEIHRLTRRVAAGLPGLPAALRDDPAAPSWDERLPRLAEAWEHCCVGAWLADTVVSDPNVLAAEIAAIEADLADEAAQAASLRAWSRVVEADRLPNHLRVDLALCAHLTRRLADSEGTPRQHAELERIRARCRGVVPARIVPVDRLAEQVDLAPDVVDVVIVLDASSMGMEATLLRTLAPRIVLFGDGSRLPTPHHEARNDRLAVLAERYLHDDPHRSAWVDPTRSLFDDARIRGGGRFSLDAPPAPPSRTTDPGLTTRLREVLTDRGYTCADPGENDVAGADLVVTGRGRRLAVVGESGPCSSAAHLAELAAQRTAERAGIRVHRVRESAFLLDERRELATLLRALDLAGIRPVRPGPTGTPPVEASPRSDDTEPPVVDRPERTTRVGSTRRGSSRLARRS